jgi:hypothetical protein
MNYVRTPFMQGRIDARDKHHAASRRLALALIVASITVAMFVYVGIQFAFASSVPHGYYDSSIIK